MNKTIQIEFIYKSIVALIGVTMLLSCENNIKDVETITSQESHPEVYGENVQFVFSDSTRIQYKAYAIEFRQVKTEEEEYNEFTKGGNLIYYNKDGSQAWTIKCNYAKNFVKDKLWELRNDVVAVNEEGKTISSELMYWDQNKSKIYSDQYVRIKEKDGQMIEGNSFTADDGLNKILLSSVSGEVFLENKNTKN